MAIELVRDLFGAPRGGAPVEHPRAQVGEAESLVGIVEAPCAERGRDGHGRRHPGLFGEHHRAVLQHVPGWREARGGAAHWSSFPAGAGGVPAASVTAAGTPGRIGSNHPMVRFDGRR